MDTGLHGGGSEVGRWRRLITSRSLQGTNRYLECLLVAFHNQRDQHHYNIDLQCVLQLLQQARRSHLNIANVRLIIVDGKSSMLASQAPQVGGEGVVSWLRKKIKKTFKKLL